MTAPVVDVLAWHRALAARDVAPLLWHTDGVEVTVHFWRHGRIFHVGTADHGGVVVVCCPCHRGIVRLRNAYIEPANVVFMLLAFIDADPDEVCRRSRAADQAFTSLLTVVN